SSRRKCRSIRLDGRGRQRKNLSLSGKQSADWPVWADSQADVYRRTDFGAQGFRLHECQRSAAKIQHDQGDLSQNAAGRRSALWILLRQFFDGAWAPRGGYEMA